METSLPVEVDRCSCIAAQLRTLGHAGKRPYRRLRSRWLERWFYARRNGLLRGCRRRGRCLYILAAKSPYYTSILFEHPSHIDGSFTEREDWKERNWGVFSDLSPQGPEQFTAQAGDVIFWHCFLCHTGSTNIRRRPRLGLFSRWHHTDRRQMRYDVSEDLWKYWAISDRNASALTRRGKYTTMYRRLVFVLLLVATSLLTACEKSPKQARRELVEKGYSYARDSFAEALRKSDREAVDLFLLAGMDPNVISGGYSALEHAASGRPLVQLLLQAGADPNTSSGVTTPLVEAAARGDSATVALLLTSGADPNLDDATDGTHDGCKQEGELGVVNAYYRPVHALTSDLYARQQRSGLGANRRTR